MQLIITAIGSDGQTAFSNTLRRCGVDNRHLMRFHKELSDTVRYSIDAFLETEGRQEFLEVGKLAIAQVLIPHESEGRLKPRAAKIKGGWHRYLFDNMLAPTAAAFCENQLRVITFNFDRSFERALFLTLRATYPSEDVATLCKAIPVVHVHGQLGRPDWCASSDSLSTVRDTRQYDSAITDEMIVRCANQIHIIHEEIDSAAIAVAHDYLQSADEVWFLGFGFHPINVKRLGFEHLKGKTVRACWYGMPKGRRDAVENVIRREGPVEVSFAFTADCDVRWMLENHPLIHEF